MKRMVKHLPGILMPSKQQEVRALIQKLWIPANRKITVCIDSYEEGIFRGRFYGTDGSVRSFSSLSRFLLMMEELLEENNEPQSDTALRSFASYLLSPSSENSHSGIRRGALASFELQILFRHHSSWQGVVFWREQHKEQSFRSVLELIFLMDSALRQQEEYAAG